MKDLILSGIQASGKGTQSRLLLEHFWTQVKYFETGWILRALQSSDNAIGNHLKELTAHWILVKDEIISGLWGVFMETLESWDIILWDGVLRRMWQTLQIVEKLQQSGRNFVVVNFDIPEEEVYKRLAARLMCKNCGRTLSKLLDGDIGVCPYCGGELYRRNDDEDLQAISTRLESFHRDTQPCIDWLEEKGLLVHLDWMKTPQEVFQELLEIMQS